MCHDITLGYICNLVTINPVLELFDYIITRSSAISDTEIGGGRKEGGGFIQTLRNSVAFYHLMLLII